MSAGEWSDAEGVDLGAVPGNYMAASLLIKNNATFVWVAYDATGDTSVSPEDSASFALDTGHDGLPTDGGEDQFVMGGWVPGGTTAHLVYGSSNGTWVVQDSPFNPSLPRHAGLAGAWGFGTSDLSGVGHRVYEFQVPLVLVGASAGDAAGLFGGSQAAPGVVDDYSGYDTWPDWVGGPIPSSQ